LPNKKGNQKGSTYETLALDTPREAANENYPRRESMSQTVSPRDASTPVRLADQAHSIAELVELIRQRAAHTPAGEWIRTSTTWDESNLAERRLPTAGELLSAPALSLVERLIPPPPFEQQVQELRQACQLYNSYGIGTVRDPIVTRDQMLVYQALRERGGLTVRSRPMFLFSPGTVAEQIADIASLGVCSGFGDDLLKIWGLKTLMDGGPAVAALDQPYVDNPHYAGTPFWKTDDLVEVANFAVRRGSGSTPLETGPCGLCSMPTSRW
jgi:predicted amidohydrolase YtcJ